MLRTAIITVIDYAYFIVLNFYNDNKIIDDDETVKNSRVYLAYAVGNTLKLGASLLGMEMPDRM